MTNATFPRLAALTHLTRLSMADSSSVDQQGLQHISALTRLQHLDIRRCSGLGDAALPCLAPLAGLTHLLLNQCGITGATLSALQPLSRLEVLYLQGNRSGLDITGLAHLTSLQYINMCNASVAGGNLQPLTGLTRLTELLVHSGSVTAASSALLHLPQLARLYVGNIDVQGHDPSRLPALTRLQMGASPGLVALLPLPELRWLQVYGFRGNVPAAPGSALVSAIARQTKLTRLEVSPDLPGESWQLILGQLRGLRSLEIGGGGLLGLDTFTAISQLPHLEALVLKSVRAPCWELAVLHRCPALRVLSMQFCSDVTTDFAATMVCRPGMEFVGFPMCARVDLEALYTLGFTVGVKVEGFNVDEHGDPV